MSPSPGQPRRPRQPRQPQRNPDDPVEATEAADYLGISHVALCRHCRLGHLPARKHAGIWWIRWGDLLAFDPRPPGRPPRAEPDD